MSRLTLAVTGQNMQLYSVKNAAGAAVTAYSDAGLTTAVTLPKYIAADTTFYLQDGPIDVVVKTVRGTTIFSDRVLGGHNDEVILAPVPTLAQIAAEAIAGIDAEPEPSWNGLLGWSCDPATLSATAYHPALGSVLLIRTKVAKPTLISRVGIGITSGIVTPTAGQNFMGLYTVSGVTATRRGVTADVGSTAFQTLGYSSAALTSAYLADPGDVLVAVLPNGATAPALLAASLLSPNSVSVANLGLTAATARVLIGPAAQTTLPATIDLSAQSMNVGATYFAAVS